MGGGEAKEAIEHMVRDQARNEAKRAKSEAAAFKAKIKADIAADRERRFGKKKESAEENASAPAAPAAPAAAPKAKKVYDSCTVMLRLLDGSNQKVTFKPDDTIGTVHEHVATLWGATMPAGSWVLANTYPVERYTPEHFHKTLKEIGLVPRGALAVQKV